ncbi:hypothetical protein ACSFA8_26685 [Variovorax sp. RT4R15]|uniref:hypothetical protein n=1 Tax=Variovorax sp. RT4R15 TaxID=3443737 RepID=UPI003F482FDF
MEVLGTCVKPGAHAAACGHNRTFTEMPQHTLFAYVDGADLHAVAASLEECLNTFAQEGDWRATAPMVVNQQGALDGLRAGDLPSWDLGLNLSLPDVGREPERWFVDVERIALFLGRLHGQFERDFIIGIADNSTGISEDLFTVDSDVPNLARLREVIGVEALKGQ